MYKYLILILLSCGKSFSGSGASSLDSQIKSDSLKIIDSNLSDSRVIDSNSIDSRLSDSKVIDSNLPDSRVIDSPACPVCPTVQQNCGMYPALPNLSTTGDAPFGEVCYTSQDYNTLRNWEAGNSTWQQCAINW